MTTALAIVLPSNDIGLSFLVGKQKVSGKLTDVLDSGKYRSQIGENSYVSYLAEQNQGVQSPVSLLTSKEYFGLMKTLYDNRDSEDSTLRDTVESMRSLLQQDFKKYWMMTGSRLGYVTQGEDYVVHGVDRPEAEQERVFGEFALGSGYLSDHDEQFCQAVFGASTEEVKEIYGKWINERDTYVLRPDAKLKTGTLERALVLGCYIVDADFDANDDDDGVARGWRKNFSTGNEGS